MIVEIRAGDIFSFDLSGSTETRSDHKTRSMNNQKGLNLDLFFLFCECFCTYRKWNANQSSNNDRGAMKSYHSKSKRNENSKNSLLWLYHFSSTIAGDQVA